MTSNRYDRIRRVLARRQPDLTVILEGVNKPHNFSAILRSCDAVGVGRAYAVTPQKGMEISESVSAGAGRWIQTRLCETIQDAADHVRKRGFRVVAAHFDDRSIDFREVDYLQPTAILLGQEKDGVTAEAAELADCFVEIPMLGMGSSLNVSVAAALILFEAQRQRLSAGRYSRGHLSESESRRLAFEWGYPKVADYCRRHGVPYPPLRRDGQIDKP